MGANRRFIFRAGSRELILPVTPGEYQRRNAVSVETVNIHSLGDVNLKGNRTLDTINIECLLPARGYPFSDSSDPQPYVDQLRKWCNSGTVVRFIIGNTGVNLPCIIEDVSFGERDGTNDVYAKITLREYVRLRAARTQAMPDSNAPRAPMETDLTVEEAIQRQNYTMYQPQELDTIASVSRKVFGPQQYEEGALEGLRYTGGLPGGTQKEGNQSFARVLATFNGIACLATCLTHAIKIPNQKK